MAASATAPASAVRSRPGISALGGSSNSPRSPQTPLLGRSISSQFGSPGSFRTEQEDTIVYELDARYFSAGFAGESKPRCIIPFTPDAGRRAGDFRQHDAEYVRSTRHYRLNKPWAEGFELFRNDLCDLDLGLVEAVLDRALRVAQIDYLQTDQKPRKAALVIPSLFPTPLLEVALKVLFGHYTQPPSITLLTSSIMCCVSAGLRDALVVEIGWEETAVTAVGEYKEVYQQRSVRAGKLLTQTVAKAFEDELLKQSLQEGAAARLTFDEAEDLTDRMVWCRTANQTEAQGSVEVPMPGSKPEKMFSVDFARLSEPVETAFFDTNSSNNAYDDEDLPLHSLAYRVLLALPSDLRATCLGRIIIAGEASKIPGLKRRLLQEITSLESRQGWDVVSNYGSATEKREQALKERSASIALRSKPPDAMADGVSFSPIKMPLQESVPHADRVHDDIKDPVTLKAERGAKKVGRTTGDVRGVESLGAWAGASLVTSMRVKGVHEIDREDYVKGGARAVEGVR